MQRLEVSGAVRPLQGSLGVKGLTAIGLLPGGSGYFTCKQNIKLVTTKFKSGGLHEKHVVATWHLGNHLSICAITWKNTVQSDRPQMTI